jgi:hypothetical protein
MRIRAFFIKFRRRDFDNPFRLLFYKVRVAISEFFGKRDPDSMAQNANTFAGV